MVIMSSTTKCRTGCPTQDHASWGECARASNISVGDASKIKTMSSTEKELNAYKDARKLGIQPKSTKMADIQNAVRASDAIGKAVQV